MSDNPSEILNANMIPGRDPLAMLKNKEPIPKSGIFLQAEVDPDKSAAKVSLHWGGRMKWHKLPEEVHVDFDNLQEQYPNRITLIYERDDYPQRGIEMFDRQGAGYDGSRRSNFEQIPLSGGNILINPKPITLPSNGITIIGSLKDYHPEHQSEIYKLFGDQDFNGPVKAVNMFMEIFVGLPTEDVKIATQALKGKLGGFL